MRSDFPEYSTEGKAGLAVLNAYWATAAFYCEDDLHEAFYERLISRIIPDIKPFYVVCVGGKSEVFKIAKRDDLIDSITEICLVDKDYDDLINEMSNIENGKLIYLRRHSIENYLAQIEAILAIAVEQKAATGASKHSLQQMLGDWNLYISKLADALLEVGRYFVVARKLRIPLQTTKISCDEIFGSDTEIFPNQDWIESYKQKFMNACELDHAWLNDANCLSLHLADAYNTPFMPWGSLVATDHLVGKHYLGGLLRYVNSMTGATVLDIDAIELYTRLAAHISISDLAYLRSEILRVAPQAV